ncbi:MAG: hypothetical protein AAGH72_06615 [Verrucomicrobiota bacterium]
MQNPWTKFDPTGLKDKDPNKVHKQVQKDYKTYKDSLNKRAGAQNRLDKATTGKERNAARRDIKEANKQIGESAKAVREGVDDLRDLVGDKGSGVWIGGEGKDRQDGFDTLNQTVGGNASINEYGFVHREGGAGDTKFDKAFDKLLQSDKQTFVYYGISPSVTLNSRNYTGSGIARRIRGSWLSTQGTDIFLSRTQQRQVISKNGDWFTPTNSMVMAHELMRAYSINVEGRKTATSYANIQSVDRVNSIAERLGVPQRGDYNKSRLIP